MVNPHRSPRRRWPARLLENSLGGAYAQVYEPDLAPNHLCVEGKTLAMELRRTVTHLAEEIGERNCYHPTQLETTAQWIEAEFHTMGYVTRRQPVSVPAGKPFNCGPQTVWNIEAVKKGPVRAEEIVVLGAHYDSRVGMPGWHDSYSPLKDKKGTPGANDKGSGIATLLALARMLRDQPAERTLHFVAFVNEEPPFFQSEAMGSLVYARELAADPQRKIIGMLCPETLGNYTPGPQSKRVPFSALLGLSRAADYVCFLSNSRSRPFVRECATVFQKHSRVTLRRMAFPQPVRRIGWSDDWAFWQQGIPAFSITDTAFLRSNDYHELSDTPEKLDYTTMAEVVWALQYVLGALVNPAPAKENHSVGMAR